MDIVCTTDDNYVQHCSVMLLSFFENNHEEGHVLHLLTEGLTKENYAVIERIVEQYHSRFCYYQIDSGLLAACPIKETDHLTIATYYRLFMADILPTTLDKVLYLDCDIVINGSIKDLWNITLGDYALAAVEELGNSSPDVYDRLNYKSDFGYFNAGVLLVNLKYWRVHNMTEVFLEYIGQNFANLKSHDQDVLNALFHDQCLHLSVEWNVEEAFYHYDMIKKWRKNEKYRAALCNPIVLHYTWKPKPWDLGCKHPFRYNYFYYLNKVQWAGVKNRLSFWRKLNLLKDRLFFCCLLKAGIQGHSFYKL